MRKISVLHLTQSMHGVWYYQRWIPVQLCNRSPALKKVFRISLRTKNRSLASKLSRLLSVKIDKLALQLFDDPKQFGKAMELLSQSAKASDESKSFQEFESNFLLSLDSRDEWLLSKAHKFDKSISADFKKLSQDIENLKAALLKVDSKFTKDELDELIKTIKETVSPAIPDSKTPILKSYLKSGKLLMLRTRVNLELLVQR